MAQGSAQLSGNDHSLLSGLSDDDHSAYPKYVEWANYTATLTDMTLGNGNVVARYSQIGKTVFVFFEFNMGGTSAMGSNPKASLPVTSTSVYQETKIKIGVGVAQRGASYPCTVRLADVDRMAWHLNKVDGTYATGNNITSSVPDTWVNGDYLSASLVYEAAVAA